jgi:hypothetical protein
MVFRCKVGLNHISEQIQYRAEHATIKPETIVKIKLKQNINSTRIKKQLHPLLYQKRILIFFLPYMNKYH